MFIISVYVFENLKFSVRKNREEGIVSNSLHHISQLTTSFETYILVLKNTNDEVVSHAVKEICKFVRLYPIEDFSRRIKNRGGPVLCSFFLFFFPTRQCS